MITCASTAHADLVVAAAEAGKAVFCEKPMAMTLAEADRAVAASRAAGNPPGRLQPPVRRRLRGRPRGGGRGGIGTPAADALADPRPRRWPTRAAVPPWTIFTADADPRLRRAALAEPGGRARRGVRHRRRAGRARLQGRRACSTPPWSSSRFDNGAIARGRGELLRGLRLRRPRPRCSGRRGMVTAGDAAPHRAWCTATPAACTRQTVRGDVELMPRAYAAELVEFVDAVREGRAPYGHRRRTPGVRSAWRWPASSRSERGSAVRLDPETGRGAVMAGPFTLAVCAEMVFLDLPFAERVRRIARRSASRSRSGTGPGTTSTRWSRTGRDVLVDDRLRHAATSSTPTAPTSCCATRGAVHRGRRSASASPG